MSQAQTQTNFVENAAGKVGNAAGKVRNTFTSAFSGLFGKDKALTQVKPVNGPVNGPVNQAAGGAVSYKGGSYKLRVGSRGGKFILVKGQKVYINKKK